MKQSGCEVPEWMNNLPKLSKRDKQRIKQKTIKRKPVDAESNRFKSRKGKNPSRRSENGTPSVK